MFSLEEIVNMNGGDDTPAMDTHNLTGRAIPDGVEPLWMRDMGGEIDEEIDFSYAPLATFDDLLDCE